MKSTKNDSSSSDSDDSDDEDGVDVNSADSDQDGASKLLSKAKEKTVKELVEDHEVLKSGVLSLPFMVRGLKKGKEEAVEEAKLALQEYEMSLNELENKDGEANPKVGVKSGRMVFGAAKKETRTVVITIVIVKLSRKLIKLKLQRLEMMWKVLSRDIVQILPILMKVWRLVSILSRVLTTLSRIQGQRHRMMLLFFASGTWKMKSKTEVGSTVEKSENVVEPVSHNNDKEETVKESEEIEGEMVDGILSAGSKASYELPSQDELIRLAFVKEKEKILNDENPFPDLISCFSCRIIFLCIWQWFSSLHSAVGKIL